MELFKIGFITVTLIDCIDIALVSFIIYRLYVVMRGTVAVQIFIGLMVIIALSFVSRAGNLKAMGWILQTLTDIWVVGFIILFQPEIRRLLSQVARNRFVRMFLRLNVNEAIEEISSASVELSKKRQGALIVVSRGAGMKSFVETGIQLNAQISRSLLLAIFNPRAPLHDGAVIVNDRVLEAARCTLPLSANTRMGDIVLGMRHRAGLGISEQTDAIAVIISEETGTISLAENGVLIRRLTPQELRKELRERLVLSMQRSLTNVKEALRAEQ
ncbi:MAG TPA: diadenylate cyclase CdaA [Bacteroidota bacterium]|nr:diadenylate cyclase CdaA [Bacteroidota bacterium]